MIARSSCPRQYPPIPSVRGGNVPAVHYAEVCAHGLTLGVLRTWSTEGFIGSFSGGSTSRLSRTAWRGADAAGGASHSWAVHPLLSALRWTDRDRARHVRRCAVPDLRIPTVNRDGPHPVGTTTRRHPSAPLEPNADVPWPWGSTAVAEPTADPEPTSDPEPTAESEHRPGDPEPIADHVPDLVPVPIADPVPDVPPVPIAAAKREATPEPLADAALPIGMSGPLPVMDLAGVRAWISDLPLQSKGAIITAAAAAIAVGIARTV